MAVMNCKEAAYFEDSDNQNEIRKGVKRKLIENECDIFKESSDEMPATKEMRRKKVTVNKFKKKIGSRKSANVSSSHRNLGNNKTCDDFQIDSIVKEEGNAEGVVMNTQISDEPFVFKKNRKVSNSRLKNSKRQRNRSNKDPVSDRSNFRTFSCFWCIVKCQSTLELVAHVCALHFLKPPYNCDRCEQITDGVEELLRHRKTHLSLDDTGRRFECMTCKKRFKIKGALAQHIRCHTGERAHTCPVCGHMYTTKATLDQHIVTHSDHRPYLCHLCGFATKHQSLLIEHRRIHNGEMFCCEMPNCAYNTTRRTQLARHMRSHLKIRQHVCSKCAQAFVEKSHLIRHERLHLEARPFKCDRCPFDCNRPEYLKVHRAKCCPEAMPS